MARLSTLFSAFSPCTPSGSYNIAAGEARHAAACDKRQRSELERKEVLSVLEDARRELDGVGTPAARRLRNDIDRALAMAAVSELSSEPASLPSLARARLWLQEARFDERVHPGAFERLQRALTALPRQWKSWGIPTQGPEYQALHRLQQALDAARRKAHGRLGVKQLHQFDLTLQAIREQASELVARWDELIHARVAWQQRVDAERFKTGSLRLSPSLLQERRRLDARCDALAHRQQG